jgi:hypothetical protein
MAARSLYRGRAVAFRTLHHVSLADGRITASLIPGAVDAMIPGTGHACNLEDPAAFDEVVFPFLGKLGLV